MSEVSRGRPLRDSSRGDAPRRARRRAPRPPPESCGERPAAALEVAAQGRGGLLADRHDAHLAALAAHDQLRLAGLHVGHAQADDLLAAQAAAVQELEDERGRAARAGSVPPAAASSASTSVDAEHARQPAAAARPRKRARRVGGEHVALGEEARQPAQRRQLARQASPERSRDARDPSEKARTLRRSRPSSERAARAQPLEQLAAGRSDTSVAWRRWRRAPRGRAGRPRPGPRGRSRRGALLRSAPPGRAATVNGRSLRRPKLQRAAPRFLHAIMRRAADARGAAAAASLRPADPVRAARLQADEAVDLELGRAAPATSWAGRPQRAAT